MQIENKYWKQRDQEDWSGITDNNQNTQDREQSTQVGTKSSNQLFIDGKNVFTETVQYSTKRSCIEEGHWRSQDRIE